MTTRAGRPRPRYSPPPSLPAYGQVDDSTIFDSAYFKVQIKKSQSGTDRPGFRRPQS
ncbi:hypothetical protein [Streptomyces justiciae]|uniref:hypothetical protein n=1 Tax=Streptomyces justiciae TaxID=2780140 RepID=UPI002118E530|nr:hypothetical protein [Streptomyces justiciae]MCW8377061.1 hypothetical protein [Streptomyces justiciae]